MIEKKMFVIKGFIFYCILGQMKEIRVTNQLFRIKW
jgi:hypothetical protein